MGPALPLLRNLAVACCLGLVGCAPERPICSGGDAQCFMEQYRYDASRKPPTFSSAYDVARTVPFGEIARVLSDGNTFDDVAASYLLEAYSEVSNVAVCRDRRFAQTVTDVRSRALDRGLTDAVAVLDRAAC